MRKILRIYRLQQLLTAAQTVDCEICFLHLLQLTQKWLTPFHPPRVISPITNSIPKPNLKQGNFVLKEKAQSTVYYLFFNIVLQKQVFSCLLLFFFQIYICKEWCNFTWITFIRLYIIDRQANQIVAGMQIPEESRSSVGQGAG